MFRDTFGEIVLERAAVLQGLESPRRSYVNPRARSLRPGPSGTHAARVAQFDHTILVVRLGLEHPDAVIELLCDCYGEERTPTREN